MRTTLWAHNKQKESNKIILKYTVSNDHILDMQLLPYDIQWSIAHTKMLSKIGILTSDEMDQIIDALDGNTDMSLMSLYKKGLFHITQEQEDGHTAIEIFLTDRLWDVGKKIHTGRSRNDQILVTMRLFTLDKIDTIKNSIKTLIDSFNKQKEKYNTQIMPGYTHTQKAMPSTIGMRLGSFSDALNDDLILLDTAYCINNQNPLWSAAWFWQHTIPVDRTYTTELLEFNKMQKNPMYCALSRGKFENIVLQALGHSMQDLWKFANDMIWFSSKEFGFFDLPDAYKTWSSIMPNKHNLDLLELVRGNTSIFTGYQYQIQEVIKWLFSGYNRDLQLTKEPYLKAIELCIDTITIITLSVDALIVNKETLEKACSGEIYATKKAYELVKKGIPFRDAYQQVKEYLDTNI